MKKTFKCPHCGRAVSVADYARAMGAKGGSAGTGDKKARTSEQASSAAKARWAKRKASKSK